MASGSPRTRIDQFYTSKKRKPLSPGVKSRKAEKEAKLIVEGSPSAKGSLANYLVTSQEDISKPEHRAHGLSDRQDPVKRCLTLGTDISSDDENKHSLSSIHGCSQTFKALEESKSETPQDSLHEGGVAIGGRAKDCSVSANLTENSELKQFATDFLSLYCSELPSSVGSPSEPNKNGYKRHGSPHLLASEIKTSKRRLCVTDDDWSQSHCEITCSITKNEEEMQSGFAVKTGEKVLNTSGEAKVKVGNNSTELQSSLRKCNNTSKSIVNMTECYTPGQLTGSTYARETPKSLRGSSIFSPGESFWNEAIQVADGLNAPTDKLSIHAGEQFDIARKAKELSDEGESRYQHIKFNASLASQGKLVKDLDKEVSPLPVKRFDFLLEDRNLDSPPDRFSEYNVIGPAHRGGELVECGFVNHRDPQTTNPVARCGNIQTNKKLHQVQEMTLINMVTKNKEDSLRQDNITPSAPDKGSGKLVATFEYSEAITPSSFLPLKDSLDLSNWLPSEICSIYRKKGISKLYPWQVECLQVDGVLQKRNLVYCASTSAGKSFVAEILMLRRVILTGKMALLVLPYVSICAEKAEHLEALLEPLGKHVRSYYGNQGGGTLPKDTSVAVCTIEKANSLINRLLEEDRLSELGVIVIDELHMVGDQNRGYLLELLLTKLRYAAGEGNVESLSGESSGSSSGKRDPAHGLQIVGMSATMPNVAAVADWLQAALYQTDFRPVPLEEYIKVGSTIYDKKMDIVRTISKAADLGGKDPDHIVELCNEVVQEGHSVLIFCSSRKGCESTAKHVSKFLKRFTVNVQSDNHELVNVTSALDALRRSPAGLDPVLEETLPFGVAYHHAGLTVEEREVVETCYRRGLVRVLTATSTLAAGVNLPARRVIFRQPRIGRDFIDGTRYKQMAGRAGRTGIDTKGESVLLCKPEEIKRIMGLLNDSCPPLNSCLSEDKNGMTHAILEVVAGGIVQTADDIHRYVRCTLLNSTKPFQDVVKSAQDSLRCLCHRKFLEWSDDTKLYSSTPLGRAAFGSSLCPEESLVVLDDLVRAREGFVLASDLHIVYLVTPINVDVEPDWELYYERFMGLSALDQSVGNRVGVLEPFLMRMAHGAPIRSSNRTKDNQKGLHVKFDNKAGTRNNSMLSDEQTLRVCKRFYVALILSRLVQEAPVAEVCEAFKVARGMVQALQENAGRFACMVSLFCERLGWHDLEGLVAKFQNRVSFGVRAEIVELTTIPYVKGSRARALYKAGLRTPQAIAEAAIPEIVKALCESSSWTAQENSVQGRLQLGVAKKIKNGARKIVLDKAEESRVAAFAAFKSLGLDVPQLSRPIVSTYTGNPTKESGTSSSGEDSIGSFLGAVRMKKVSAKPSMERIERSSEVVIEIQEENLKEIPEVGLMSSSKVVSTGTLQCNLGGEKPVVPAGWTKTLGGELDAPVNNPEKAGMSLSTPLGNTSNVNGSGGFSSDRGEQEHPNRENVCLDTKDIAHEKGPINATCTPGGIDSFLDLWDTTREFFFDVHFTKQSGVGSIALFEIHGMAICWEYSPVYYVNLPKDLLLSESVASDCFSIHASSDKKNVPASVNQLEFAKHRWNRICKIFGKQEVQKFSWHLKVQIQVLKSPAVSIQRFGGLTLAVKNMGPEVIDSSYFMFSPVCVQDGIDMSIVAWILWPDEERSSNPSLEKEVKKRLSAGAAAAAGRSGRWKNQMRRAAHNGCCRRVAQTRALCSVLWKLLGSEDLVQVLMSVETPLVNVLADMEIWGIGVDMDGCLRARHLLGKKLKHLEREAYRLAGMTFSLYMAADIANVLYGHLKLPIPEGRKKGKKHPSTDKHSLDLLRHEHPLVPIIKEHRTLAKLLNCTLGSICSMARLSMRTQKYTLHGHWLQTSTATGRLSMEEPNLQCVEHTIDFKMNDNDKKQGDSDCDHFKINARDFFIPTQDHWVLLTADYSQIELRLMAHFSKDSSLVELLSKPHGDVFTMIAARWTEKPESSVESRERDQTKRLVYGILYGMGANTLAEQLECSRDEAAEKIQSFKSSFPGVASWLHDAVAFCRQNGYVVTLRGRKRFLSKIKLGNSKEKSKAQRQAVNSICQGSAADIIKIAMINLYSVIAEDFEKCSSTTTTATQFEMLRGRCRILLQVHDELVLEVDPSLIKEAGLLLQMSMENAASLLVPLHVKMKVGRTWGSLEPFQVEQPLVQT